MATTSEPTIRAFQLDDDLVGTMKKSVNLYRGQVTLPLPLVSLPGRNGVSVQLTAMYRGVTKAEATTWNMSAPTGVIGLGWTLPLEQIVAEPLGDAAPGSMRWWLSTGGSLMQLVPTGTPGEYATADYQFWRIVHDEAARTWTVTRDDGSVHVYGGPDDGEERFVEVGVRWGAWNGSSVLTGGETYPVAFDLRSITDAWGDTVTFGYAQDLVPIGPSGPSYTQSARLTRVTDTFGRRVDLRYEMKTDDATVREIQPAHVDPTGGRLFAYQERLDTRYLARLEVSDDAGLPLLQVVLRSATHDFSGTGNPYLAKRCLEGVHVQYPGAAPEPGVDFTYNPAAHAAPGALASVRYPEGGLAEISYGSVGLQNAPVVATIPSAPGTPRVWFGADYVVFTFQKEDTLSVAVYQWTGGWSDVPTATLAAAGAVEDLRVLPQDGYFVVYYRGAERGGRPNASVFVKDPDRPDAYRSFVIDRPMTRMAAGRGNLLGQVAGSAELLLYRVETGALRHEGSFTLRSADLAIAAAGEAFVTFAHVGQGGAVGLLSANAAGAWSLRTVASIDDVYWDTWVPDAFWSGGVDFASATYFASDALSYSVSVLSWTQGTAVPSWTTLGGYTVPEGAFTPASVTDNVVAQSTHLFRFDGASFVPQDLGPVPGAPDAARFAYGIDVAVRAVAEGGRTQYGLTTYDPYQTTWTPVRAWGSAETGPEGPYPATIGVDYLTIGNAVFFRGARSDWKRVEGARLGDSVNLATVKNLGPSFLLSENTAGSATNLVLLKNGSFASQDGRPFVEIRGQRCFVPDGGAGTALAGPRAFVTYDASASFEEGVGLTLYRVIDDQLDLREVVATAVVIKAITFSGGAAAVESRYDYDEEPGSGARAPLARGATFDVSGRIAQFSKVLARDGIPRGAPDGIAPFGTTVKYFLNGVAPEERSIFYPPNDAFSNARSFPSLMNGLLVAEEDLGADGTPIQVSYSSFWVYTRSVAGAEVSYIRQRRSVQGSNASSLGQVAASRSDLADLDRGVVPASVASAIAAAGMGLSGEVEVIALEMDRDWLVLDDGNDRLFPVRAVEGGTRLDLWASLRATVLFEHAAENGLVKRQVTSTMDAGGRSVDLTTDTLFLVDVAPQLARARNMLSQAVQTTTSTLAPGGERRYTGATATLYWPYRPAGAGGFAPAPSFSDEGPLAPWQTFLWTWPSASSAEAPVFGAWTTGTPAAPWRRQLTIAQRSPHGLATEKVSLDGVPSSYVYDARELVPVARFINASVAAGEASYYDFEPYEANPGWTAGGAAPQRYTGDAHTGTCCYRLPGEGRESLRATLRPQRAQPYVFSCWVKTARGAGAPGAAWTFTRPSDGHPVAEPLAIPDTEGRWLPLLRVLDLSAGESVAVSAGSERGAVLVDNLRFSPLHGAFTASAIDPRTGTATATLGSNGETIYAVPDYTGRIVAQQGPDAQGGFQSTYLFRSAVDVPAPVVPSSALTVAARTRATYAAFRPDTWQDTLHAGDPAAWEIRGDALVFRGSRDTLTLSEALPEGAFAWRMQVTPPATLERAITLRLGERHQLVLEPGGASGVWSLRDAAGATLASSPNPRSGVVEWCVVASGRALALFVAGARVVSRVLAAPANGPLAITVEQPGLALQGLVVTVDPVVTMSFLSVSGQTTQSHVLDADRSVVREVLYDGMGWQAVTTKPALAHATEERPPLAYRDGFAVMDWTSGRMSGEVSVYYSAENPEAPSDDQGYPFTRQRYDAVPVQRVVEVGLPGAQHAIGAAGEAHTTRLSYGVNLSDETSELLRLPAGQYAMARQIDPDGIQSFQILDKTQATIATGTLQASGRPSLTALSYSAAGDLLATRQPASFDPPAGEAPALFEDHMTYDMLHGLVGMTSSDALTTEYVRDPAGRLRFMQDPRGRQEGYYCYTTYDGLRRVVESGYLRGPWDRIELQRRADNLPLISGEPDWPPPSLTAETWSKRLSYDGDGSAPNQIGNLSRAEAAEPGGGLAAQAFGYDAAGNLLSSVTERAGVREEVRYTFDAGSNLIRVTDGDALDVSYRFDATSQLVGVGKPGEGEDRYASYRYHPGSLVAEELLDRGRVRLPFAYDSLGRPTRIGGDAAPFVEQLGYERRADGQEGYWNGRIASATYAYPSSGAAPGFGYEYTYDELERLVTARCTDPAWSLGAEVPAGYDANGNLVEIESGGVRESYAYRGNVVTSVAGQDTPAWELGYDANDAVTSSSRRRLSLSYDRSTLLTDGARVADAAEVSFTYDAFGAPLAERTLEGARVTEQRFTNDAGGATIVETVARDGAPAGRIGYVRGPTGIVAIEADGTYFVVRDHLGSSRLLLAEGTGAVVAGWDYLPFGAPARSWGDRRELLSYQFTGQRRDAATGLYALGCRMYDPELRRFYARDPASQYASPYVYVGNDPVALVDPTGMVSAWGIVARVSALVVGAAAVAAGVTLQVVVDVATLGTCAVPAGAGFGALIGFGVQTMAYTALNWNDFNAKDYFIQAGIGAVAGALSGGIGVAGSLASASVASAATGALGEASAAALGSAVEVGIGVVASGAIAAGAQAVNDLGAGQTPGSDVGFAALYGLVGGAIGWGVAKGSNVVADRLPVAGSGSGMTSESLRPLTSGWMAARAGAGVVGAGLGAGVVQIVANVTQGETWDSNLAFAVSIGAALGAIGALPKSSQDRYQPLGESTASASDSFEMDEFATP